MCDNGQPKPNLRHKRNELNGSEGLLEIVGLEMMVEGVRAGTYSESWRGRVPDYKSCNAETASAKLSANNGTESIWVFHDLREQVNDEHAMPRGVESAESDVGYCEVNTVFSGEPLKLFEKIM